MLSLHGCSQTDIISSKKLKPAGDKGETVLTRNAMRLFFLYLFAVATVMTSNAFAGETQRGLLPAYNLSVSFDLKKNLLKGTAEIVFPESGEITVTAANLTVIDATLNGKPVEYRKREGLIKAIGKGTLEIKYEAVFRTEYRKNLENTGVVSSGIVSTEGISLTGNWYPAINGLAYYKLSALVPQGFEAISEADEITSQGTPAGTEYSFTFPHPVNGIDFIAANYKVAKENLGDIWIYAYFFPEDAALTNTYIDHARTFLETYSRLLVPYPYKRFSIVENIQTTGYSMPTFTLLGQEVVRLPFIVRTSLGHEITHQWFGNYVYADFSKGNWLEAITTYLSDYRYEEEKGKGWEYRKKILIDYQSYVTPQNEFPLRDFVQRSGFASMAIGYGKGAMLFHMLRNLVGEEAFYRSLRRLIENNRFRNATWEDIRRSFEADYGNDLGWFFSQWLDRKGIPSIAIRDPRSIMLKGVPSVSFRLRQEKEPYRLTLPIEVITGKGTTKRVIESEKEKQYFDIDADGTPKELVIDRDYEVMRRLEKDEFPPVISRLLGDEKRVIVYSEKEKNIYSDLIKVFKENGFEAKETGELKDEEIRASSLLVLGYDNPVLKRLFAGVGKANSGFVLTVKINPMNTAKVVAYANAGSPEEVSPVVEKIFHYGRYTTIRFENGKNVEKETPETKRGMVFELTEPIESVIPKKSLNLEQVMDRVAGKPVIFIGERHTNYEDHKVELDIIRDLYKRGKRFAIGMEMFQRPFQKVVNDYIAGTISEREFLKKSQYFRRWGFNYNLYREIIEFAKAKGIHIVALNLNGEIIKKVALGGIDALSPEEKKEIPQDMNLADYEYRDRLKKIYGSHPPGTSFDNFYQSQILWDETMAHSAADFLKKNPGSQLVVIAGAEHIMYGSGIPERFKRLTGKEYTTLINGVFDEDIGNYVVFANSVTPPFSARLGVIVRKRDDRVVIENFSAESPAMEAGMKKGDALVEVGDWKIESPDDVRIALFDKKPYESVRIKVIRRRFLLGEKELEFNVNL
jgi:aminopeptidase N